MKENVQNDNLAAGRKLRAYRLDRGLSRESAAQGIGVSAATLRRLEMGGEPQAVTAKAVADFYATTPSELWVPEAVA